MDTDAFFPEDAERNPSPAAELWRLGLIAAGAVDGQTIVTMPATLRLKIRDALAGG
jgi:hypothetical protein